MKICYLRRMVVKKAIYPPICLSCRRYRFSELIKTFLGWLIVFSSDAVCIFCVKVAGKAYAAFPGGIDIKPPF